MKHPLYVVLRSGGNYTPEHVERLRRQVPNFQVFTLTDIPGVPNKIPLLYNWPGWWSKLELCRPDIVGDLFYLDLDSTVVGDLSQMSSVYRTTMLSDFYRPEHVQSSVMLLTQNDRRRIWQAWISGPYAHIDRYKTRRVGFNGDQNFIEDVLGAYNIQRFQTQLPGQAISYKVHIAKHLYTPDFNWRATYPAARVIVFHGKPRPFDIPELT